MVLIGKQSLVIKDDALSVAKQCKILQYNRSSAYYKPKLSNSKQSENEEYQKSRIDYWHTKMCYLGVRTLRAKLQGEDGLKLGRKKIAKLMREMGIYAVYPKPNLSKRNPKHKVFDYLLKNLTIKKPNQVWAIDITYIKMGKSHMYLTAIIDWYSRFVVGYELSDTLETAPVLEALSEAIRRYGKPEIINSDQGSQFTSEEYVTYLKENGIRQSMDGRARWVDNVIIERWFRSLKCNNIYINEYNTPRDLRKGIDGYVTQYNTERPHESLQYQYPIQVYHSVAA